MTISQIVDTEAIYRVAVQQLLKDKGLPEKPHTVMAYPGLVLPALKRYSAAQPGPAAR